MVTPQINLLITKNMEIYKQLQLEEALLRTDDQNWCLINQGSPPAIVLGISSKIKQMINLQTLTTSPIPLIKRFSGGGTVIVDENTLFTTLIFNANEIPIKTYPLPILKWGRDLYHPSFQNLPFDLKENDFVIGNYKCAGNAQYLTKKRWLLHTSWLWDFNKKMMNYLTNPKKQPNYRQQRSHNDFLTPIKTHFSTKNTFVEKLVNTLNKFFELKVQTLESAQHFLEIPHRKTTQIINYH
jgi:lipoate---protein ligase